MQIVIIGTGYVGLVVGTVFADYGSDVVCVDEDRERIAGLNRGEIPFRELALDELVERNIASGRLRFSTSIPASQDAYFICVGTPQKPGTGEADTSQVFAAARAICDACEGSEGFLERPTGSILIVVKSTVPVGTCDEIERLVLRDRRLYQFSVASVPEFLKEGSAVDDLMRPDRIVIGTNGGAAGQTLARLYAPMTRTGDRILYMDRRSAEMSKYAANGLLAAKISYMNEIAAWCDRAGADVDRVRLAVGSDSRIGPRFLYAGIGYGGSCFPKDVRAAACQHGDFRILKAVHEVNEEQKLVLATRLVRHFGGEDARFFDPPRTIAIWGLAFKPGTDDVRESPAIVLARALSARNARLRLHDPVARENARRSLSSQISEDGFELLDDPYEAARGADALVLCTEWREYCQVNWMRLGQVMPGRVVFDGRNAWNPDEARAAGFAWHGIGRR
jgi:UDPglucose 6-dehydrogenase